MDGATTALSIAIQAKVPVLIWGVPGTGKTSTVQALGQALGGKETKQWLPEGRGHNGFRRGESAAKEAEYALFLLSKGYHGCNADIRTCPQSSRERQFQGFVL